LNFRKIQNILGDGLCGYYGILSQLYDRYGENTLGPDINNEEIRIKAKNDAFTLKESIVKPYLQNYQMVGDLYPSQFSS
jgi:hypothetical protein